MKGNDPNPTVPHGLPIYDITFIPMFCPQTEIKLLSTTNNTNDHSVSMCERHKYANM